MMDGGGQAIAAKPAPLWPSRQQLQARIDHLKTLPDTQDLVELLQAAMVSKANAAALLPAFATRQRKKYLPAETKFEKFTGLSFAAFYQILTKWRS
jgi:hypothetical protein